MNKYIIVAGGIMVIVAIAIIMMSNSPKIEIVGEVSDWEISKTANGYTLEMYIPEFAGGDVIAYYNTGYATKVTRVVECINENGSVTIFFPPDAGKITIEPTNK